MSQIKIKQVEGLQTVLDAIGVGLQSGSLKSTYTQIAHGFSAGSVVAFLNGSWVLADASSAEKLGRLVVESVTTDTFVGVQIGNIEIIGWGLTPGKFYMVDETGNGTVVEHLSPSIPNFKYSNPVMQALTTNKAQVLPWRPSLGATPLAQGQEYTQTAQSAYTSGNGSNTGIFLDYTPFADSTVQVYINGIAVTESYGNKDGEAYFSNDNGITAAAIPELIAGSKLYWNPSNAGYEIGNGDTLDLVYEKSSLD
jgi:hypothetical protein